MQFTHTHTHKAIQYYNITHHNNLKRRYGVVYFDDNQINRLHHHRDQGMRCKKLKQH